MKIGLSLAFFVLLADQASKYWLMKMLLANHDQPIGITGFFNLVMVWNFGISFGMLSGLNQPLYISLVSGAIILALIAWLSRSSLLSTALALGLVIGGAAGNIVDRAHFGAVADFFDFHIAGYHWPAFNLADSAIFIGVVVLCWQSMLLKPK